MRRLVLVLWLAAGVIATPAAQPSDETSQLPPLTDPRTSAILRVFLDCRACDENYLRTEITFVDYVRDRTQADVHLLITTQSTGGGGTEYSLKFIGLGRFHGHDDALTYAAPQTNTSDETRRELVETVKLGLVHYVAQTSVAPRLRVTYDAPEQPGVSRLVRDPWKFWVFRIGASSSFEGESTTSEKGGSASFSAKFTTSRFPTRTARSSVTLSSSSASPSAARRSRSSITGLWRNGIVCSIHAAIAMCCLRPIALAS